MPPLVVPAGWTRLQTSGEGLWAYVTHFFEETLDEEEVGSRVPATLVVTVAGNDGQTFGEWQRTTDGVLPELLEGYVFIDAERLEICGHPGGRRLGHHRGESGAPLTMEQWFVAINGVGHTLTFTVDTRRYDALADLLAECAETWTPQEAR